MEAIYSQADIKRVAVDAADAGQSALCACPWPLHSAAANEFHAAYALRITQLNTMAEA